MRVDNAMHIITSMVALTNAVSMLFTTISSLAWAGSQRGQDAQIAIVCLQLVALCGELSSS